MVIGGGICVVDAVSVAFLHERVDSLVSLRLLAAVSSPVPPATTRLAVCACARALNSAVVVVSAVGVSTNMSLVIPLADNKSFTIPLADLPESCHEIITLLVDEQCPLSVYLTAIVCAVAFFFYDTFVSTLLCMWVCIVRVCASLCVCVCVLCLFLCSCVRVCVCVGVCVYTLLVFEGTSLTLCPPFLCRNATNSAQEIIRTM